MSTVSFTERLARLFRARPCERINGLDLASIGGAYAWRSRVAELRKPPYAMDIRNFQTRVRRADGTSFILSSYAYLPPATDQVCSATQVGSTHHLNEVMRTHNLPDRVTSSEARACFETQLPFEAPESTT